MAVSDKTMFEIYRESEYNRAFRFIFYTDLEEHARDDEIARAAAGDTILSGFIDDAVKEAARAEIEAIVDELNDEHEDDVVVSAPAMRERLAEYLVSAEPSR